MTTTNVMEFDPAGLFEDVATTASPESVQVDAGDVDEPAAIETAEDDSDVDPDADTVLSTPAEDEDDGPQPGDDLDEEPTEADGSIANAMVDQVEANIDAPAGGISPAENALVEIYNAERRCRIAKGEWESAKEAVKTAKEEYDGCVNELRRLASAVELDRDRPLLKAAEAVNAQAAMITEQPEPAEAATDASDDDEAMFDDDEIAANLTSDAVNEHLKLQPGQLRIRLTREIVDEHPTRGKLTWTKGTVLIANVDANGTTIIPFADDPTDGTGLEAEEFDIIEEPATSDIGQDDSRFELTLDATPIAPATVKLLAAANINTVREFEAWRVAGYSPKVDKLGQTKIEKAEAAMVEFWKGVK